MRRGLRMAMSMLAVVAGACAGTSTGNPAEPGDEPGPGIPTEGGSNCQREVETLDGLDAQSPLGFSAADMLALTDHGEVAVQWRAFDGLSTGPESGRSTLQIDVGARDTAPRFVDQRQRTASSGGPEIGLALNDTQCPDLVELDVRVHVRSGGGALDEHFDAALRASSARVARIYATRKAADIEGTFDAELKSPNAVLESVQFDMSFSAFGTTGALGVGLVEPERAGGGDSATRAAINTPSVASWPADGDCESGSFGTRIDRAVGQLSARAGIERFNSAAMQLRAPGVPATGLHANFTAGGETACVVELDDPDVAGPSIELAGTLAIRSGDGRIDGRWPMGLRVSGDETGNLSEVRLAFDLRGNIIASLVDAAQFESTYGIHGIDVSSYDQAGIVVSLTVGPAAAVSGELVVNGAIQPDCPPPPPPSSSGSGSSSPGCRGISLVPLWTASIAGQQ